MQTAFISTQNESNRTVVPATGFLAALALLLGTLVMGAWSAEAVSASGSAWTSKNVVSGQTYYRANAIAVALAGAVVVMLLLMIGGAALILAQQSTRRTLEDIGATPVRRIGLAARWVTTPVAFMLVGLLLTMVVATKQWTHPLTALGWYWLTPFLGGPNRQRRHRPSVPQLASTPRRVTPYPDFT